MPYRRKDSPGWWVSYTNKRGQRIRRATGTQDRKEAEALEAKWKLEAFKEKQWDEKPARTLDEVLLVFLKARSDKRSAADDRYHARRLLDYIGGDAEMDSLTASTIRGYMERRKRDGVANATINRELALLSAAINYCNLELEWQLPNPVARRKLKEPEGRVRWITLAEAEALIKAATTSHLKDFIRLALNTGMRLNEMLGLEWDRVDWQQRLVRLEAQHTKSAKRRTVPLNEDAYRVLLSRARFRAEYCPDSPWVFALADGKRLTSIKTGFATARRRAGIKDFRVHDLRHTCAAWLVTSGVALVEVRDLLGHASVIMTERYAHLAPENVRGAVAVLDGRSRFSHVRPLGELEFAD